MENKPYSPVIFLMLFLLLCEVRLHAQFSGSNLLEYQYGILPADSSNYFSGLYSRSNVQFSQADFDAKVAIEQYHSPYENRNYVKLQQYSLGYDNNGFEVKVGNFYETLGRGLLLRSFEVPSAILDDASSRARHYFHRDMEGASLQYASKNVKLKALYGLPLNYVFDTNKDKALRRPDIVQALYAEGNAKKQTLGAAIMSVENSATNTYAMTTASGNIGKPLGYYVELATDVKESPLGNNASYGMYINLNYSYKSFGFSGEYKNYVNFLIGSGINEPPALVKEHTYRLLNRGTHVLQPFNETGFQTEVFYMFRNFSMLTANVSYARNEYAYNFDFYEMFLEYSFTLKDRHSIKTFADFSREDISNERNRIAGGIYSEWLTAGKFNFNADSEWQILQRGNKQVENYLVALGMNTSKFTGSVLTELSNDYFITETMKVWLGLNTSYKINDKHTVYLFAGERRGGPACNAGICYEVPDFEGFELRLMSKI